MERRVGPFQILVGCFSVVGVVFTIIGAIVTIIALFYPRQLAVIVENVLPTATPIVITLPTPTPIVTTLPTPTAVPTSPTPSPTAVPLPFKDDFDTGLRPEWQALQGTWRMVDGTYAADETDHQWAYTMMGDLVWQDYAVEVDVATGCVGGEHIALLLRSKDRSEGVQLQANYTEMKWVLYHNGQSKEIAVADKGLPWDCSGVVPSRISHLRLEVKGNIYSAYLDGELVSRVQDDTFVAGRVGLGTTYSSDVVRFDNFVVAPLQ